jgi:type II secretory pathway pseudopilin PulG
LSSTGDGRLPEIRRGTARRAAPPAGRRRAPGVTGAAGHHRSWAEWLSSASVILAGVLVVIGFGFVASRAMRTEHTAPNLPEPQAPALGDITLPPSGQGLIPLQSPSGPPSRSPSPSPSRTSASPPPDPGGIILTRADVPATVDLTAEGSRDWVHWGEQSTFSLERDKKGGFAILEGAPTAPRFRHALSPQRFAWTGGDPVDHTDGTPTGIRTCGKGNGFTISAPAAPATRVLRLYVGTLGARGRLSATLTTGSADGATVLEQRAATMRTAVLTVTYRAPRNGRLQLKWTTDKTFATGCAGVSLQAATLR